MTRHKSSLSPRRPQSAPLYNGRRPPGRAGVGPDKAGDSHDQGQVAQLFRSFTRGMDCFDPPYVDASFRTRDFSKLNEKRCKYDRHGESPLDATLPPAHGAQLSDSSASKDVQDGFIEYCADASAHSVEHMQLLSLKQELIDGFRSDLLDLGQTIVGTFKQEFKMHSQNMGQHVRLGIEGLARGVSEMRSELREEMQLLKPETVCPVHSPREELSPRQSEVTKKHMQELFKEIRDTKVSSSSMCKALHEDIMGIKSELEAREVNLEQDFASVLQALDRRIQKIKTEVDFTPVLEEIQILRDSGSAGQQGSVDTGRILEEFLMVRSSGAADSAVLDAIDKINAGLKSQPIIETMRYMVEEVKEALHSVKSALHATRESNDLPPGPPIPGFGSRDPGPGTRISGPGTWDPNPGTRDPGPLNMAGRKSDLGDAQGDALSADLGLRFSEIADELKASRTAVDGLTDIMVTFQKQQAFSPSPGGLFDTIANTLGDIRTKTQESCSMSATVEKSLESCSMKIDEVFTDVRSIASSMASHPKSPEVSAVTELKGFLDSVSSHREDIKELRAEVSEGFKRSDGEAMTNFKYLAKEVWESREDIKCLNKEVSKLCKTTESQSSALAPSALDIRIQEKLNSVEKDPDGRFGKKKLKLVASASGSRRPSMVSESGMSPVRKPLDYSSSSSENGEIAPQEL